jgi:hypothetical protein
MRVLRRLLANGQFAGGAEPAQRALMLLGFVNALTARTDSGGVGRLVFIASSSN